ncbi:hypothetical protein ACS0X5_01990 [Burkholderia gladioli]|uniref:TB domain-containing protein n=1 Tax=Burkholderia gladioli (strain BSR3) TaxID=999541 RepID=F2LJG6_BURGS|nr:hypothetical protein [Burkholderia gladioli]AEA62627.1 hypothetical protein bgla_2g01480 [Burkholderia gladioli BSR3]MBW5280679.1 hypothetical protein [Burkholderia gladioli]NHH78914.1 hypothetical protein [Burkholderia gladioli]CAG9235166.1 conserved exported hypothetical protein [Burkholderia gladioli]
MSKLGKLVLIALASGLAIGGNAASAAARAFCYYHHNCPDDGKLPKNGPPERYTKQQCKNGGGKSWGDDPKSCENVNK